MLRELLSTKESHAGELITFSCCNKEYFFDDWEVLSDNFTEVGIVLRITNHLAFIKLPLLFVMLEALAQDDIVVGLPLLEDALHLLFFFINNILVVGEVWQVTQSLINKEVTFVPSIFIRIV